MPSHVGYVVASMRVWICQLIFATSVLRLYWFFVAHMLMRFGVELSIRMGFGYNNVALTVMFFTHFLMLEAAFFIII